MFATSRQPSFAALETSHAQPLDSLHMRRYKLSLPFSFALLVVLSACAGQSSPNDAPANTANAPAMTTPSPRAVKSPLDGMVSVSAEPLSLRAGERAEAQVRLSIADGYHVNANPATEALLIPTTLEITPEAGITAAKILYPKAVSKKFSFSAQPLAVYQGEAVIKLAINAPRGVASGAHALRARVRVQPCDNEKCYPPGTIETSIPLTIR